MRKYTRRQFIQGSAATTGGALLGPQLVGTPARALAAGAEAGADIDSYLKNPEGFIYSACLQCNTGCAAKVRVADGVAVKIDGNPYSPMAYWPHLPYKTSLTEAAPVDGWLCPKGQAGLQSAYDPYRIRRVLKRAGRRGEQKWQSISFEQAVDEIVNGGSFADGTTTPGLKEIRGITDPKVAKDMASAVTAILNEKDATKKQALVDSFKSTFAAHLDGMIEPDHPDLGPKNNQFTFAWGRLKDGRGELIKRFTGDAMGSVNGHGHTTVCQGSLYFTGKAMSEQFVEGKWTGGSKFYWQADVAHTEFLILVGANVFEANYGPPYRAQKIIENLENGDLKYVVIDPRLGKTGAKAWKWLPNKPGTEAAIGMALIRLVIEAGTYNTAYLENANKAAADEDGEPNYCNASWLVKVDAQGQPGKLLRGSDLGLPTEERPTAGGSGTYKFDPFVVMKDGLPVTFDSEDTSTPVSGELLVSAQVDGVDADGKPAKIAVKSVLQALFDSAKERTVEEWPEISGVEAADLVAIAQEFTSHGRRAAADIHRGVSQHTNGYYNVHTWYTLNLMIGNNDYAGGMAVAKAYDQTGSTDVLRSQVKYESSTLYAGYPTKRPWFPLATDLYQEIIPSIGDAYPYPTKALFLYMGSPVYSLPAGNTNIDILSDTEKLPLFVCFDITVGETSMYADYIIPDLSYLERWEFHKSHPSVIAKNAPIRQPAIAPLTETVGVFGVQQPLGLESFLLGIAEKMALPGFGPDGFGVGKPFQRGEDLYLKEAANIAAGEKSDLADAVPEADDAEMQVFLDARAHLPATTFDVAAWKAAIGGDESLWRRIVYVLNRGGRFQDYSKLLDGEKLANKYGQYVSMYCEKTYDSKNTITGKRFSGLPMYVSPCRDSLGNDLAEGDAAAGYDLTLITYKTITQTKSRTSSNYWLHAVEPTNHVLMSRADAAAKGLADGDLVLISSASNPEGQWNLLDGRTITMTGSVMVAEGIRPGVVAFSLGYGHWAYGGADIIIDGETLVGDARRLTGIHANAAMRTDTHMPNTCLSDLAGGSAVFYDTRVKVTKA